MKRTPLGRITPQRLIAAVTTLALAWLVTPAVAQNAYITNELDNTVSVIDTGSNMVIGSAIAVGTAPVAFGIFIQPRFAGTVGSPNCHGTTVSVLAKQHGGLPAAATALGFANVSALQNAIKAFCGAVS